jgi:methylmalonyl-CoA carboxyltransferase 12S subunit
MSNTSPTTDLAQLVEELRAELHTVSERLARLEAAVQVAGPVPATPSQSASTQTEAEPVSEEIMLVIAAAVAAFLGERAHIRQVRLIRSAAWAQQGRVSIQASHQLPFKGHLA